MSRATIIDNYFKSKNYYPWIPYVSIGSMIIEECNRMGANGLWVTTACAQIEQESGGKNMFGCDWGNEWTYEPPYCQVKVTAERVRLLIANYHEYGSQNGIGLTQLTYMPYVMQAQNMGGAHLPRYQMRVGFKVLNDLLNNYDYYNALEAYNDGNPRFNDPDNPYELQFEAKHLAWKERLR